MDVEVWYSAQNIPLDERKKKQLILRELLIVELTGIEGITHFYPYY